MIYVLAMLTDTVMHTQGCKTVDKLKINLARLFLIIIKTLKKPLLRQLCVIAPCTLVIR